jgi:iron complex outermembrane receptor protein
MVLWALFVAAAQGPASQAAPASAQDIIVTGELVKRTVRRTASSVRVVSDREIAANSASDVEQVLALVPNVTLGHGSQGPNIRGQDTTGALHDLPAFLGGNRPRTTLVVDGRRNTYSEFVFGAAPVWDVDRIEVFRTPQTTTEGQNSIAGAIFVTSKPPSFEPEARVRVIAGNLDTRELSAVASGPLSPDVAVRVAGDLRYSHTGSRIVDKVAGAEPNHEVYGLARAKLLVKPRSMPGSQLQLTYVHNQSQSPQVQAISPPFEDRRDVDGGYGVFRISVDSLTASASHAISQALELDVTASGGDSNVRRLAPPGAGQAQILGRDWALDGILHWSPDGPLRGTAGVSRTHLRLRQVIDLSILSGIGRFHDVQESSGLFGEAELAIGTASLTAGLRYQQDRQDRYGSLAAASGAIPLAFDRTFRSWLPKISLAWDVTSSLRIGTLVQKAYNPGGTTLRFDTGLADNFGAERLWNVELFARARLGTRLSASANVFHYSMRNAQRDEPIFIFAPNGFLVTFANLFNVPRARSSGAELDLNWNASARLSARGSIGLLATRIIDADPADAALDGKQFDRSPHFTASAAIDWQASDRLRLSAQARHHSRYYSDNLNTPAFRIAPSTIVDGRAEYRLLRLTVFAYARNLFDRFALIERTMRPAYAEDPREIGVGVETRF